MCQNGMDAEIVTDPVPTNGQDYQDVRLNIEVLDGTGGTPTLDLTAEVSNDGQNFMAASVLLITGSTTTGLKHVGAQEAAAFVRYKFTLKSVGGAAGDLAWMTCDLHVNFMQS